MIHDDVDHTASITFDETKVEAKIERVSKVRYWYSKSFADSQILAPLRLFYQTKHESHLDRACEAEIKCG
jgi:hypothetical protein